MHRTCVTSVKLIAALCVVASAHAAGGDPEAGRRRTGTCNACHSQTSLQSVPSLGGQSPSYFLAAMRAYQDGKRAHATMRDVAKAYTDKELKNFAAYYAQFAVRPSQPASVAPPSAATACDTCHGPEGRTPLTPDAAVLAGQKVSYLKSVLREYRDGFRKHALMQPAAASLSDADIDTLAEHYSKQEGLMVK